MVKLGEALRDQNWIDKALKVLKGLVDDGANGQGLDIIAGSAGVIPALLTMYYGHPQDFLLELATRHSERLLDTAIKTDRGWSWDTMHMPNQHALTGFSHGTSGIAWALLELYRVTKKERFRLAAEGGFAYERSWFSAEHGNWPDLRSLYDRTLGDGKTLTYNVAWCHGAPGIGLSRLRAYQITGDVTYREEAEIAIQTTAESLRQAVHRGQGNFSLCHGLAGNAELLIHASQVLANKDYESLALQVGDFGIESFEKNRIP